MIYLFLIKSALIAQRFRSGRMNRHRDRWVCMCGFLWLDFCYIFRPKQIETMRKRKRLTFKHFIIWALLVRGSSLVHIKALWTWSFFFRWRANKANSGHIENLVNCFIWSISFLPIEIFFGQRFMCAGSIISPFQVIV